MAAYYNDHDKNACAWLRELIKVGLIADGEVDERSILDVRPVDLAGFSQCHFFAGIGGWSYALRLTGWPDDRPVWTGSPPCQPFSVAGRGLGREDARHLAPHFVDLVRASRPGVLFGEQVASAEVFGPSAKGNRPGFEGTPPWAWIDDLSDRLEAAHYAVGANDFPSAGVGAPHIRQRTFFGAVYLGSDRAGWLGHAAGKGSLPSAQRGIHRGEEGSGAWDAEPERHGSARRLADRDDHGYGEHRDAVGNPPSEGQGEAWQRERLWADPADGRAALRLADEPSSRRREEREDAGRRAVGDCAEGRASGHGTGGATLGMGDSDAPRGAAWIPAAARGYQGDAEVADDRMRGLSGCDEGRPVSDGPDRPGPTNGFWASADWLASRDGKWRPVEPGTFPLAHGLPARVGRLRGYGNAINPHAAAEFVMAFMDAAHLTTAEQEARHAR